MPVNITDYLMLAYGLIFAMITFWAVGLYRSYRQFKQTSDYLYRSAADRQWNKKAGLIRP